MRTAGAATAVNLRAEDPAEVLRGYAERAAGTEFAAVLRAAYKGPNVLAATTAEEEEEMAKREKEAFLLGNVAGTH
jgi:hypothetical protein